MTITENTRRAAKPGDYARWDAGERHVLCHHRSQDGEVCPAVLALPHVWRAAGRTLRLLRLPHTDWALVNGVWREGDTTRRRRQQGWEPLRRTAAYHDTAERHNLVARYIPDLPVWVRCPACTNKRRLDGNTLGAVGEAAAAAYWEQGRDEQPAGG
jgi:hypothetical protein